MIKDTNINVVYKGGGTLINLPPIFSQDGRYLYVAKQFNIISYNVETGSKIIDYSRVNSEIIGFGIKYISNSEHVIACLRNGTVLFWKAATGLKLREIKLGNPVKYFKLLNLEDQITAFICSEHKTKEKYLFNLFDLKTENCTSVNINRKLKGDIRIDVSNDGSFVGIVQNSTLYYHDVNAKVTRRHLINNRSFTYVHCHPVENAILTGDDTGRVVIWENLLHEHPAQGVYHWHTLPVKVAQFSQSGTQIYSGGSECVLVKWIIKDDHKSFLPRLSGFIEHISISQDNQLIALSTSDNAIYIVTPQLKIKKTIQHLVVSNVVTDMVYDGRSRSLVFNGISGHVQFYSPKNLDLLYSLDVSNMNKYTNERGVVILNWSISHVAVDRSGLWMATVEERNDPEQFESRLKFWYFNESKQSFTLNTSIEYPHEGFVKHLLFQSTTNDNYCVSIGDDLKFKLWQLVPIKTVYHEGLIWECSSEISYRNLTPNVASFSSDGSLLAVGFESIITTWLPDNGELKCSLRHPIQKDDLLHISFGAENQRHLIFAATKTFLSVWNLLTLSIVWSIELDVHQVISDVAYSYKAVFTPNKELVIFDLTSPNPVYQNELNNVNVMTAAFVPKVGVTNDLASWNDRLSIYMLTSNFELFAVESQEDDIQESNLHIKEDRSFFQNLLPEIRNVLFKDHNQQVHIYTKDIRGKRLQEMLETPVPSLQLSLLSEDILGDSLLLNPSTAPETSLNDKIDSRETEVSEHNNLLDKEDNLSKIANEKMSWISILM